MVERFGVRSVHEIIGGIVVLFFLILLSGIKIVREHDRLVIFRFGKIIGHRGPGIQLVVPLIDRSLMIDTRITALSTPTIEVTTKDQVPIRLSALCRCHIKDPAKAVAKVDDPFAHTLEVMHTLLSSTISEQTSQELFARQSELNGTLKRALNLQATSWGVRVNSVEIKEMVSSNGSLKSQKQD